jgi:hypothetical protein
VGSNVNGCEDDDRPSGGLVEGDVLVKGDDLIERCATEEGNEIAADGEEDEDDVNVEDKGSSTGDS